MTKLFISAALAALLGLAACQSTTQTLDKEQIAATKVALNRGRSEMSCPSVTATILSRNLIQLAAGGPNYEDVQRAQYTIGVSGCDKKQTYVAICHVGSASCVSVEGR
jgi:hypothetical protein